MRNRGKRKKKKFVKATCINFLYIWFHQHNGIGYFRILLLFSSISSRLAQRIHHRKCEKVLRMILSKKKYYLIFIPSHNSPPAWLSLTYETQHFIPRLNFMLMIFCTSFSHEFINNLICISLATPLSTSQLFFLPLTIFFFSSFDERTMWRVFLWRSNKKRSRVFNWKCFKAVGWHW